MTRIDAIAFDLEGTLFRSKDLEQAYLAEILKLISKKLCCNDADRIFKLTKQSLARRLGYCPTTSLVVRTLGIPKLEFHRALYNVQPTSFIKPRQRLKSTLFALQKKYKLALLTNVNRVTTESILDALGLPNDLFCCMLTATELRRLKPDFEPFILTAKILDERPESIAMIGDRVEVDLRPAKIIGMKTILISTEKRESPYVDYVLNDVCEIHSIL